MKRELRDRFSPPAASLARLLLGFRVGPESDDERRTRVGETRYFRAASIWVRLRVRQNFGTSTPSYDGSPTPAVTGITVTGDAVGRAKSGGNEWVVRLEDAINTPGVRTTRPNCW
jgi:hypothetical protein